MHPSGFDTRAVASDETATFMSIALGKLTSSVDAQIGEVLAANSFLKKIQFLKDVFINTVFTAFFLDGIHHVGKRIIKCENFSKYIH